MAQMQRGRAATTQSVPPVLVLWGTQAHLTLWGLAEHLKLDGCHRENPEGFCPGWV